MRWASSATRSSMSSREMCRLRMSVTGGGGGGPGGHPRPPPRGGAGPSPRNPMVPIRAYLRLLRRYLRPLRGRVALLSAVLFAGIACQAVNPQLIRAFIDRASSGGSLGGLLTLAAGFTSLAVGHQILNVAATYIAEQVGWQATNELRADLAEHLLRLDMGFPNRPT